MKQTISIGFVLLTMLIWCSCKDPIKNELKPETTDTLKRNKKRISSSPLNPIPSPIEWIQNVGGSGPYQPSNPQYLYVGDEPDFKFGNKGYSYYVEFHWEGFPTEGPDFPHLAADYVMQIQYRYNDVLPWFNINSPAGNGLTGIKYTGVLEDISAFVLPYCIFPQHLYLRTRVIHKSFLTSSANNTNDGPLYDYSLVSPWSEAPSPASPSYYNPWGFAKPQPAQPSTPTPTESESYEEIIARIYFPSDQGYTFKYNISNVSAGLIQSYFDRSPNFLYYGECKMTRLGSDGGQIIIDAECKSKSTGETYYYTNVGNYGEGETSVMINFNMFQFLSGGS